MTQVRFFIRGELLGDGKVGKVELYAEDENGDRIPPPDLSGDAPLRRLTLSEKKRKGLDRLLDDIMEADDDPIEA